MVSLHHCGDKLHNACKCTWHIVVAGSINVDFLLNSTLDDLPNLTLASENYFLIESDSN